VDRTQLGEVEALGALALPDAGDVDVVDRRRGELLRREELAQGDQPRVGHLRDADVGLLRGGELVRRLLRGGEDVEEGRLADLREAEDAELHRRRIVVGSGAAARALWRPAQLEPGDQKARAADDPRAGAAGLEGEVAGDTAHAAQERADAP